MRFFVFVFSFFIMGLSAMPCLDSITCKNEKSTTTISDNHNHSEDEGDLCSPFCICSCCGCIGFVLYSPQFFSDNLRITERKMVIPYYSEFHSSYFHSFWQPPKLS